ncbi:MAG: D-aminoacylase [Betaproteobacteria bacterium]|nr:D-aminoacylase [Betaproteobacteria bacterium]
MAQFDLVIRGGTLADGGGGPLYEADIAVAGGRIAAVGKIAASGAEEIDAKGRLVTPGFVDIHTHYDGQAMWDARLQPSSWHGVTTAVMGNCGVGFAPVRPSGRERLVELMEGVEDIPGTALHAGLDWAWESFGEYMDALAKRPHDIDICAQLPHGALRVYVMGERGARLEPATPEDIAAMRRLTQEAMRAGAIGFSTSRTLNHRTVTGDPTPSLRASEEELLGIALGMQDAGSGVIEFISDFDTPDAQSEFAMVRRVLGASHRPFSVSLAQRHGRPEFWRDLLGMVAAASADGFEVKAQIAPRPIGVLLGLSASRTPFSMCASYKSIAGRSVAEKLTSMRDPAFRARLLLEATAPLSSDKAIRLADFGRMYTFGDPPDYEPPRENSVAAIAAREGRSPLETAYDLLLENEGRAFLYAPFANYAVPNLDACREMIESPHTLIGLGDGGAHVGVISDASFPTFLLSYWGRDRAAGRFDIGWLVKRHTEDNCRAVGLLDRGRIAAGMKADMNVIDLERLSLQAPTMAYDLPAGGKRLLQRARGYAAIVVSGAVVYRDGEPTGALPGRLVRGQQSASPTRRNT